MSDKDDLQLAAEMAAISTVKSEQLVKLAGSTGDLQAFQSKLEDSKDKVEIVKQILANTETHEITKATAEEVDAYLGRVEMVEIPVSDGFEEVLGAEHLGRSLDPAEFHITRLIGCENFLNDFFQKVKQFSTQIGSDFKDFYLVLTQTVDSLSDSLDLLEKRLQTTPNFKAGTDTILLGVRLYNLFKINGKVNEEWITNVSKLNNTVGALSTNYYINSGKTLNNTLSFFGGFGKLNDEEGLEHFLELPKRIPSTRFKECTYPNKEFSDNVVTAKQSVELMGGAYFLDTRVDKPNLTPKSLEELEDYLQDYLTKDMVGFNNNAPTVYPKIGTEIKTLSSESIRGIIKLLREVLKSWKKSTEGQDRYRVNDSEFSENMKSIYESDMSDQLKEKVRYAFDAIVRKNQTELLTSRAVVSNYLVLVFNGLIELANISISANPPE